MEQYTKHYSLSQVAAHTLCWLFHPILMAVVMSYLVMYGYTLPVQTTPELTRFVMGNVALVTIGVPLVFRVLIQFFGVEKVGSRRVSILSVGIFFLSLVCCGAIFAHAPMLFMLRKMFYAAALVCVLVLLFETFYPLCHQTVALSAVLGMMWVLLYVGGANLLYYFIFGVVALGLVATARLYLSERSPGHTLWAIPVGALSSALMFIVL